MIDWLVLNIIMGAFNDGYKLIIDNVITTEKVHNKKMRLVYMYEFPFLEHEMIILLAMPV